MVYVGCCYRKRKFFFEVKLAERDKVFNVLAAVMQKIIVFTRNNTQDPMVHLALDPMCFI